MSASFCIKCGNIVSMYEKYCEDCVTKYRLRQDTTWNQHHHGDIDLENEWIKDHIKQLEEAPPAQQKKQKQQAMINPHLLKPEMLKQKDARLPGGKLYIPRLWRPMRHYFKRRSEAETYMEKVHVRWCRLYDAAILMITANAAHE